MAKNHYRRVLNVNVDFDPPVLTAAPQFIIDSDAIVDQGDTLIRTMWWFQFVVRVTGGVVTHLDHVLRANVSVGGIFYNTGTPGAAQGPWDIDRNVVTRAHLESRVTPLIANPVSGAITGYGVTWSTPAQGITSFAQRKGVPGGGILPTVEFSLEVNDVTSELYTPDGNRTMHGWLYCVTHWATDGPVDPP